MSVGIDGENYEINVAAPEAQQLLDALNEFIRRDRQTTGPSRKRPSSAADATATLVDSATAKVHQLLTSRSVDSPELLRGDPDALAERMVASIPSRHVYDGLVGPFYDTTGLRKWLGLTRQALASRVSAGSLLACPTQDGQLLYPAWQFRHDGSTVPHLPDVIKILRRSAGSPWTIATWLRAPGGDSVDGLDAVSWLDAGGDAEPILTEAGEDAVRWGS